MTTGSGLIVLQDECEAVWRSYIEESLSRPSFLSGFDTTDVKTARFLEQLRPRDRQYGAHRYPHLGIAPRVRRGLTVDEWYGGGADW